MQKPMTAHKRAVVVAGITGVSTVALLLALVSVAANGHVRSASPQLSAAKHFEKSIETIQPLASPKLSKPDTQLYISGLTAQKRRFVTMLSSAIAHQNERILGQRQQLQEVFSRVIGGAAMNATDIATIAEIAIEYDVDITQALDEKTWSELFARVDAIPPSLALSQAATESGWGTSRLARQNNNYFGERCFVRGCGQIPPQRQAGTKHEIADFASVEESVQSYFRNINTHSAYAELRQLRMQMRLQARPLEGPRLADGLQRYSTRGGGYIKDVKLLIRSNNLDQLDQVIVGSGNSQQLASVSLDKAIVNNPSVNNSTNNKLAIR